MVLLKVLDKQNINTSVYKTGNVYLLLHPVKPSGITFQDLTLT